MSATEAKEIKGGRPPTEKVAGSRQHGVRRISGGDHKEEKIILDDNGDAVVAKSPPKGQKYEEVQLSGSDTKAQPTEKIAESLKHTHNKPLPTKEKPHHAVTHTIQQPR